MECVSPVYLKVKGLRLFVPCNKCLHCLQNRRAEWTFRLRIQQKNAVSAAFLTLTYTDDNIPIIDGKKSLRKSDLQKFFKRLRYEACKPPFNTLPPISYYAVGEYGTQTFRPHYHVIIFNVHHRLLEERLTDIWGHGNTVIGSVTHGSIHYVTKYVVNKGDFLDMPEAPFAVMSNGIGSQYLVNKEYHKENQSFVGIIQGQKMRLPRYLKDQIFDQNDKRNNAIKTEKEMVKKYQDELTRLKNHPNAETYLVRQKQYHYERIKTKINKKNTL